MNVLVVVLGVLCGTLFVGLGMLAARHRAMKHRFAGYLSLEDETRRAERELTTKRQQAEDESIARERRALEDIAAAQARSTDAIQRSKEDQESHRVKALAEIDARSAELTRMEARTKILVSQLESQRSELERANAQRAETLNAQYESHLQVYQRLQRECALLQDNLEDISYGHYKPSYSFDAPEKYKNELERVWQRQKELIRDDDATHCPVEWTVGGSRAEGKKLQKQQAKLMLRAFNGETEAAVARVSWNNATKMEERIRKSFDAVNTLGTVMHVEITKRYLDLAIAELRLSHEYEQKKQEAVEEQRQIREQMREEERALREAEKAQEEAEKEEARYQKALEKARAEIAKAKGAQLETLNGRIQQLEASLAAAQQQKDRAKSMAQLTKSGHVYIISNVGSFGEHVFKIGMTRRLDPHDRVKELGDASVPFEFDVHAMVYTEDAPGLENEFHRHFAEHRVNLANHRKEFFAVNIEDIEHFVRKRGLRIELTRIAQAKDYRQSVALRAERSKPHAPPPGATFPNHLLSTQPEVGHRV